MQENENNNIRPDEQRYVPKIYRDGKNPVLEMLISFLIMVGFLLIQVLVMIPMTVVKIKKDGPGLDPSLSDTEKARIILDSLDTVSVSFVATLVSMIIAVIWYRKVYCKGYGLNEFRTTCKKFVKPDILTGLVFAAVALYFITFFVVAFIDLLAPDVVKDYNKMMEDAGVNKIDWKVIILTVVFAPINEECIMRGIILTRLKKNMAPVLAIVISAVYFGIFHLNIVQGIYACVMGLFMAYIAYKYRSVLPSILFHAMFNALNYLLQMIPEDVLDSPVLLFIVPVVCGPVWYFLEGRKKLAEKG